MLGCWYVASQTEWGYRVTVSHLESHFSEVAKSGNIEIRTSRRWSSPENRQKMAHWAALHWQDISETLQLENENPEKITVFVYRHKWEKQHFTGAKDVSFVPVWIEENIVHLTNDDFFGTVRHELVHVAAKSFGNKTFGASWNPALIEGLAVAISPDISNRFTIDELVLNGRLPLNDVVKNMSDLGGFYFGRSGLNYTVSGSFLRYFMQHQSISVLKTAYPDGNLAKAAGIPNDSLVQQWSNYLQKIPIDSVAASVSKRIFSRPSILEVSCPRSISVRQAVLDSAAFLMAENQPVFAEKTLFAFLSPRFSAWSDSVEKQRDFLLWNLHRYLSLAQIKKPILTDSNDVVQLAALADAFFLAQQSDSAFQMVNKIKEQNRPDFPVSWFEARTDTAKLDAFLTVLYRPKNIQLRHISHLTDEQIERWISGLDSENGLALLENDVVKSNLQNRKNPDVWLAAALKFAENGRFTETNWYLRQCSTVRLRPRQHERLLELSQLLNLHYDTAK